MKLIPEIPSNKYNDLEYVYNFLQNNKTVGNETLDNENYFHCFWKGKLLPIHLACLESILKTQTDPIVMVWVPSKDEFTNSEYYKYLPKAIEVREASKDLFLKSNASKKNQLHLYNKFKNLLDSFNGDLTTYNHDVAYASDIFRFIVLSVYGGVWFDMDVLFLKDLKDIKLKNFVYKWGIQEYGNGALMRLEKGNDIIDKVMSLNLNKPFYPTETFTKQNNLDIWMLPTEFFDIIWKYKKYDGNKINLPIKNFDDFFNPSNKKFDINFLNGCFTYHWHNHWDKVFIESSPITQIYYSL